MDIAEGPLLALSIVLSAGVIAVLAVSLRRAGARLSAVRSRLAELTDPAKQSDDRTRENERHWRRIVETVPQLVWTATADGSADYFSPQSAAFTGRPESEFMGWGWLDALHPDDRETARAEWARAVAEQREYRVEHRFRRADGAYRWFLCCGVPARNGEGRIVQWIGTSVDVTDRKVGEERAERAKRNLELILRISQTSLWEYVLTDGDVRNARTAPAGYTFAQGWNAPLGELTWASTLEHSGMLLEHHERVRHAIQQCVDGLTADFELEAQSRAADGSLRWRLLRGSAWREESGRVIGFTGVGTDITDLKRAAEETRALKERLERSLLGSKTCTWHFELTDGTMANSRATFTNLWEQLGYPTPTEDIPFAQSLAALMSPEDQAAFGAELQSLLAGRATEWEYEHRVRHKDGSDRWQLARGMVERDPASGRALRFTGSSVDITEKRKVEADLQRAREIAEAANRAKDEFLANVSHEIRTPMNAILGMTELALESVRTDHQKRLLATVKSAAQSLLGVINDLLDFSKIAAGKVVLEQVEFLLRAELSETVRALAARAHRKGLEIIWHVHMNVPDVLLGDSGRLRQVLMNLVGNAIKFTSRGEVVVEVTLAAPPPSPPLSPDEMVGLTFRVRDTGIGIASDKQVAIFRAFEQEDSSTTRKYGGTGLGLTISAQLVALMGGTITVDSAPGQGSTFAFTARFGRSAKAALVPADLRSQRLEGLRVLVVDDNETNRGILAEWLTNWRMRPTTVGDASSALAELARSDESGSPYALALLDARMPDVDGIALAGRIVGRGGSFHPSLILLSSDDSPALPTRSREAGARAYLLKPVDQSELLETISLVMTTGAEDVRPAVRGATQLVDPTRGGRSALLRILVAEDNELNVALLRELFLQRGHLAQFVSDGVAAVARAAEGAFDLLLLDLHLPEMDGFGVVEAIRKAERETGKHLPIIALTARSSARDRERCLAAGMDEFLSKPIEADALWSAVERTVAIFPPARPRRLRLLDHQALRCASGGQVRVLERLREVFRTSLPGQLDRVRSALRDGDLPGLREAAHQVYATLAIFSTTAGAVASTIEESAWREDLVSCTQLVERLDAMSAELLEDARTLTLDELSLSAGPA